MIALYAVGELLPLEMDDRAVTLRIAIDAVSDRKIPLLLLV